MLVLFPSYRETHFWGGGVWDSPSGAQKSLLAGPPYVMPGIEPGSTLGQLHCREMLTTVLLLLSPREIF